MWWRYDELQTLTRKDDNDDNDDCRRSLPLSSSRMIRGNTDNMQNSPFSSEHRALRYCPSSPGQHYPYSRWKSYDLPAGHQTGWKACGRAGERPCPSGTCHGDLARSLLGWALSGVALALIGARNGLDRYLLGSLLLREAATSREGSEWGGKRGNERGGSHLTAMYQRSSNTILGTCLSFHKDESNGRGGQAPSRPSWPDTAIKTDDRRQWLTRQASHWMSRRGSIRFNV